MADARSLALASQNFHNEPFAILSMPSVSEMVTPILLARLFSDHWPLIKDIIGTDQDRLITTLFDTLHYVTNRIPPSPKTMVDGEDLVYLGERLFAAIKLIMLRTLGFTDEKLASMAAMRSPFIHLKAIKEPWGNK
jgi:hypothetical protein